MHTQRQRQRRQKRGSCASIDDFNDILRASDAKEIIGQKRASEREEEKEEKKLNNFILAAGVSENGKDRFFSFHRQ
jgi:hypothetical protein